MQVCIPTSAANYFHLLRRQLRRPFRKPLIVIAPKKLLKYNRANSDIAEFQEGLRFHRVYNDPIANMVQPDKIKKVIFCAGQVYYDLDNARTKEKINDVALIRVEQLCPFPFRYIIPEI
jgi:2-oxoglutarate dehydrogenase E1 component